MKNNPYSLQLLSHSEHFATHDEAVAYINQHFKTNALMAEPALFFYGTEDDVKMILAVGCDDEGNICLLENEQIQLNSDVEAIIEAAGLVRENGSIVYKPDVHDNVLVDATSLADAIARLSEYAHSIDAGSITIDDIKLHGDETDTTRTNIELIDDTFNIGTEVRLSSDRSIIVSDGGISANVDVDVNEATNTITITIGNKVKTFSLPGVNIIENIVYDAANKNILIYVAGQQDPLVVPIGDIVETWSIENPSDSPVELHRHASLDGTEDKVYATLKLRSENNLIGVNPTNGEMYVSREAVTNVMTDTLAVYDETIATMQSNIANNSSEISRVETKVDNEITRATTKEQLLTDSIATTNTAITEEVSRAQVAESQLASRIQTAENSLATVDSRINERVSSAIAVEQSAREATDAILSEQISNLAETVTSSTESTIEEAKSYTDSEITRVTYETNTKIDEAKSEAITTATTNAQNLVSAETARATSVENALTTSVTNLQSEMANKIESVTVERDSDNELLYRIVVDGVPVGSINIPKDQFLKDASYNSSTKDIELVCETTEGERTLRINVADLVDTYTAGNGLTLANNQFSVRLNNESEPYLTVGENGIKLSGIDAALANKADKSEIADFATNSQIEAINETISTINQVLGTIDDELDIINGNEAQEGSILNALSEAKSYTDTKVSDETSRATAVEQLINEKLSVINGNEATEGSIKKALKDAKDYTDTKVTAEAQTRASEISRLETALQGKANSQDVYTKAEIDAKGYLTDASLALYSTKAELNNAVATLEAVDAAQNTRLDALEAKDTVHDNKIANIESELVKINVVEEDTNSIDINVNKTNAGTKIKADLKLDSTQPNIIRVSGNGVYANVDITYNAATNTLVVNNGVDTRNIQLSDHTLVNNGYYDSEHKAIVLVTTIDGQVRNIEIPVSDLLNVLQVENTQNNPIILTLNTDANGVDVLSATINISNASSNAIVNQNGTLYASKNASDMYATWGLEPQTITIQQAIDALKTQTDKVDSMEDDVDDLQADVNTIKNNIIIINNTLDNLSDQVDENTQDIADNTQSITELTTNYNTLSNTVNSIDGRVTILENKVSAIENEIDYIKDALGEYDTSLGTIAERLANIERFLQNGLIDANDRNANEVDDDTIVVDGNIW